MDDPEIPSAVMDGPTPDTADDPDWPLGYPGASPASFWDRSTWDPNTVGAMTFGQPTAPWRPPGQVDADAMDALLTGPSHPGWAEPITRMAIDRKLACMDPYPPVDGPLTDGLRLLAAQPDADLGLKTWAAKDALIRAGMHPLEAQWAMNAAAQAAPVTRVLDESVQPSAADADDDEENDSEQDGPPAQATAGDETANNGARPPLEVAINEQRPPLSPPSVNTSGGSAPAIGGASGAASTSPASTTYRVDTPQSGPLPPDLHPQAEAIARDFRSRTGKRMVITSTYRDAKGQAGAMYDKFDKGSDGQKDYGNKTALKEIHDAYVNGVSSNMSRPEIIESMHNKIQDQIDKGVYISNHMIGAGKAMDVSIKGLSKYEKAALIAAIIANGAKVHPEKDHLHVNMISLRDYQ